MNNPTLDLYTHHNMMNGTDSPSFLLSVSILELNLDTQRKWLYVFLCEARILPTTSLNSCGDNHVSGI